MTTNINEARNLKILTHGMDRSEPLSFRKKLDEYFDTQQEEDHSFYWNLLLSSIRIALNHYSAFSKSTEFEERLSSLSQQLNQEEDNTANALTQIVQLWETEEFQKDFNSVLDPEVLRAKNWLRSFVPLASEVLNKKRSLTAEDVPDLSLRLTGIVEDHHAYGNTNVTAVLIGGRRNERKKWIHAFDNVSASLIFIPADTLLLEQSTGYVDDRQSAFLLYRDISASKFLSDTPVILFISRINLLEDAINSGIDVKKLLPDDYKGDIDARSIVLYFIDKFCELRNPAKPFFAVCGDLVDKHAMKKIIPYILQTLILSENSTKKLSNVIVDPERNLFVYYPTKPSSTFVTEIRSALNKSEPSSSLSAYLKEADSDLVAACKGLINSELHADLKIKIGQSILQAHSLILQARAPDLLTLWTNNGLTKDVDVTDLDVQPMLMFLEYIYTDAIELVESGDAAVVPAVLALLKFADKFALQPFMQYLCRAMADKMHLSKGSKNPSLDISIVQELLQFGEAANSDYLQLKCTEYLLFLEEDNRPSKPTEQTKPKKKATRCIIS